MVFVICLLLQHLPLTNFAQDSSLVLIKCIDVKADILSTDALGNIYVITEGSLQKYSGNGSLLFTYTSLSDGPASSIDTYDPLKLLVFNAGFSMIKLLDNTLSLRKDPVQLSETGYSNASLVCTSYESGFWIFDPVSNNLIRFDNNMQISQISGNINDLTFAACSPVYMLESDNTLYVSDPTQGILLFDRYGAYLKTIPIKNIKTFQIFGKLLLYSDEKFMKAFDLKTHEEFSMALPIMENIISARVENRMLVVLTSKKLCIYNF